MNEHLEEPFGRGEHQQHAFSRVRVGQIEHGLPRSGGCTPCSFPQGESDVPVRSNPASGGVVRPLRYGLTARRIYATATPVASQPKVQLP